MSRDATLQPLPGPDPGRAWLAPVALAGQLVVAVLTATLARSLDLAAFEAYAVAAAIFVGMVAVAPLGADRLVPVVLPPAFVAGDAVLLAALARFAAARALAGTAVVAVAGLAAGFLMGAAVPGLPQALLLGVAALPAAVCAQLCLEALAAAGRSLLPTAVLRLGVPLVALAIVGAIAAAGLRSGAALAIGAWGMGWALAALLLARRLRGLVPRAPAGPAPPGWRRAATGLWLHRVVAMATAQAPVVMLALLGAPPVEVGAYAVASTVAGLGLLLATSTSRAYAREVALLLDRGDPAGLSALGRGRLRWLVPVLGLFLLLTLAVPERLLALFRPEFSEAGATPLRLLAVATTVSTTLALAPVVLKLRRRNGFLLATAGVFCTFQLTLLALLVPSLAATGAALAFLAASTLQYTFLAAVVRLGAAPGRRRERPPKAARS